MRLDVAQNETTLKNLHFTGGRCNGYVEK